MLTTIDKAKSLLGIPADDETDNGQLALYLAAATSAIETYCRRSFRLQEYKDRKHDGVRGKDLLLEGYPIVQVSKVQIDGVDVSDYETVAEKGILFRRDGWKASDRQITLTYTAGYVLPGDATPEKPQTLPESLELACVLFCQTLMRTPGVTSERVGDLAVSYANDGEGLPAAVKSLVNPYKRWG
ncbi:phage head-tail connector protein [Brevibacillus brevis]|uniref:phage head-tail connector protein n=1 Tax=Brevibacillus brevis TaxID=1393 RepID=UPI00115ACC72|nr:phage head-tail connector protein [Lysinibacillus sp. SDF0063]TQR29397.1 phage gp6-like head-tail connector protein [Lysinibacillus sp. SDF0063]